MPAYLKGLVHLVFLHTPCKSHCLLDAEVGSSATPRARNYLHVLSALSITDLNDLFLQLRILRLHQENFKDLIFPDNLDKQMPVRPFQTIPCNFI